MKIGSAVDLFLKSAYADGLAVKTVEWYRLFLSGLVEFCSNADLSTISASDLQEFLAWVRSRDTKWEHHKHRLPVHSPVSVATLHAYVRSIKRFYNWLVDNEHIQPERNVAIRLRRPKLSRLAPKEIAERDFKALLEASRESGRFSKRNYAVLLFLMDTGCRVGGLVNLRVSDLEFENGRALVTEKGRKSRYLFLKKWTIAAVKDWLNDRPIDSEFVFPGRFNQWSIHGVYHLLRRLKKRAGISGRVNPHSFRHTFAKLYLLSGGDLASLADILGHADVTTTKNSYSIYLTEELREKHEKHSPLGLMAEMVTDR